MIQRAFGDRIKVIVFSGCCTNFAITMALLGFYMQNSEQQDTRCQNSTTYRLLYIAWLSARVLNFFKLILVPPISWSLTWHIRNESLLPRIVHLLLDIMGVMGLTDRQSVITHILITFKFTQLRSGAKSDKEHHTH